MTTPADNNDFEIMTNKWKQIFMDFIELIINDNGDSYEIYRFHCKILKDACPTIWRELFLMNFQQNISIYYGGMPNENTEYSEVFMRIVVKYFNEYQFADTQIETIKQYLKYLCVEEGLGETYYADIDDDTAHMNNVEKHELAKEFIILTSEHFVKIHKSFIENAFISILTPDAVYLK